MTNPSVTFIVPVFNREVSVAFCLNSILDVHYDNFEVVVVDDGSTDKSSEICKNIAASDSRIKYYRQPNKGVSAARNLGLEKANGEWITFVDSDDAVLPNRLDIMNVERHGDVDMLMIRMGGGRNHSGKPRLNAKPSPSTFIEAKSAVRFLFDEYNPYVNSFYNTYTKLFRKNIIDEYNIRFDETMSLGEDQVFVCDYLCHANGIIYTPSQSYCIMDWKGLLHLGSCLRTPEDFLYNQKKNYEALSKLEPFGGG